MKRLMNRRDRALNKWRQSKTPERHAKFKALKTRHNQKCDVLIGSIETLVLPPENEFPPPHEAGKASKTFWGYIRSLKKDNSGVAPLKEGSVLHCNSRKNANILNRQYKSAYTKEDLTSVPELDQETLPSVTPIRFSVDGVLKLLQKLEPNKAQGPEGISPRILKELAPDIAPALTRVLQASYDQGTVPREW